MYRIEINKANLLSLEMSGNLSTIEAEVLASISVVYERLKEVSEYAAKDFKENLERAVKSGFLFSNDDEKIELVKKELKETIEELLKKSGKDGDKK